MFMLPFFGALLHGTLLAVLSFFVLFAASKAEGRIKSFGLILGTWLIILALIVVVGLTFMTTTGARSFGGMGYGMMQGEGPGWMHRGDQPALDATKP